MKLEQVTKLEKRNKTLSKKIEADALSFIRFMANLEQYRCRIPDA